MPRRYWPAALAAVLWAALAAAPRARAGDPMNSDDKPVNNDVNPADRYKKDAEKSDFNLVPVVGGSTDIGFGAGYFSNYVHLRTGWDPFVWDIESAGFITFGSVNGSFGIPYADIYLKLMIPRLFGMPIRLELRPSYTTETTVNYYGIGDNSSGVTPAGKSDSYNFYGRTHPQLDLDLRFRIADHFSARAGARFTRNWFQINPDSKLADDLANGSAEVKSLLGAPHTDNVLLLKTGLQWDTRDNEASTYTGSLDTIDLRVSPGGSAAFPYRYGEMTVNLRWYVPIRTPWMTLALRWVANWMFGDVPFYELSHFDDTYALGGTLGVRGIPAGRYSGRLKTFGNIELRNELATFHALGKALVLGATAFFDAGRLWADGFSHPELDGTGLGLKYGAGAGLRLQSGSAFVLRADLAWSPDATPISGYVAAGQMF